MSIDKFPSHIPTPDNSWVAQPARVIIEYTDGTIHSEDILSIDAQNETARLWVEKRLGSSAVKSFTVEFLDQPSS